MRSRFLTTSALTLVAVAVCLSTAAPLAGGDAGRVEAGTIAVERGPTGVASYGGTVVWSSYDRRRERYRLRARYRGRTMRLPVRSRRVGFDADVGPDPRGRPVVVYSRCRREPERGFSYVAAQGCDVFRYDFARRSERRVPAASRPDRSEFLPSVWKGRVAFARAQRGPRYERLTSLYLARTSRGGRARRLPGGSERAPFPGTPRASRGPGLTALDLRGSRVTFSWAVDVGECEPGEPFSEDDERIPDILNEVWVVGTRGERRLVDRSCPPKAVFVTPRLTASSVSYGVPRYDTDEIGASSIRRLLLRDGRYEQDPATDVSLLAFDVVGDGTLALSRELPLRPRELPRDGLVDIRRVRPDWTPIPSPLAQARPSPGG